MKEEYMCGCAQEREEKVLCHRVGDSNNHIMGSNSIMGSNNTMGNNNTMGSNNSNMEAIPVVITNSSSSLICWKKQRRRFCQRSSRRWGSAVLSCESKQLYVYIFCLFALYLLK
jgi:hypothetical protein